MNRTYNSYEELAKDFGEGLLHPGDLKPTVARIINELIDPVRKHFETDPQAKALINKIKTFKKDPPKEEVLEKEFN
jgi:tyrosyl-tRNA synthetase